MVNIKVLFGLFIALIATVFVANGLVLDDAIKPDPRNYAAGTAEAPYQARALMVPVERWAYNNHRIASIASHRIGPFHDPGAWPVFVLGFLSIALCGFLAQDLYHQAAPDGRMGWLVYPSLLMGVVVTWTLHNVSRYLCVYDLPSMLFFTLGIWLAWKRRYWLLVVLMPVAALNRETAIMIVLAAWLMDRRNIKAIVPLAVCCVEWFAVTTWAKHRFPGVGDASVYGMQNIRLLSNVNMWPGLFAAGGFLWVALVFYPIPSKRLRKLLWLFPVWYAVMALRGVLFESRIFGELIPLLAVMSATALGGSQSSVLKARSFQERERFARILEWARIQCGPDPYHYSAIEQEWDSMNDF